MRTPFHAWKTPSIAKQTDIQTRWHQDAVGIEGQVDKGSSCSQWPILRRILRKNNERSMNKKGPRASKSKDGKPNKGFFNLKTRLQWTKLNLACEDATYAEVLRDA